MLSSALLSVAVVTAPAMFCQSVRPPAPSGSAWLPSPPWKVLPGSGLLVGVNTTAEAVAAPTNNASAASVAVKKRRLNI